MKVLTERDDGRMWVKLCGFRDPELASVAVAEGADAVGVVMHGPSPRDCAPDAVPEIVDATAPVPVVAVVVDRPREELADLVATTGVAAVQLCGTEAAADVAWLHANLAGICVIRARRVPPSAAVWGTLESDGADAVLVDADVDGQAGGSGVGLSWQRADCDAPVILAGGLDATNVVQAVRAAEPFGLDVSSALEVERGTKDRGRIREFMDAVRTAVPR